MLWVPLPNSVTPVLQLPLFCTIAVPSVVLPLSNSVTVVPMSATSTVPDIVWAAWLTEPPAVVMDTVGAVVSIVAVTAAVVVTLPAASVALAVKLWLPSGSGPVVKLQLPPLIVAAPRSVAPSNTCTDDRLASPTVPDSASVLSLVTPPLEIVVVAPVSVPIVLLIVSLGLEVSSVKLSAAVPVLPNASVWLATMVCDPSDRPVGVNDQTPAPFEVVVPRTVVPSVSVTTALASLNPVNASFEVILSANDAPVSATRLSVTVGPMVLKV